MPNETETPANTEQEERASATILGDHEQRELPPFPPRPETDNGFSSGYDGVGKQYRAIQDAQLLHEETLKQLREEIRTQKIRLSELSDSAAYPGRTPQLDAVFLRLSELERKMGEGAPDPLLNEIVHRLAALENSGRQKNGGPDRRVDELVAQVEKLRKRASEPSDDARVDDVVLRIASVESAYRRANPAGEIENLSARLESLRSELEEARRTDLERFQGELRELSSKVGALQAEAREAREDTALQDRLDEISDRLNAAPWTADAEAVRQDLDGLRQDSQALREDFDAVRQTMDAAPWTSELEGLRERMNAAPWNVRIDDLHDRLEAAPWTVGLDALAERLDGADSARAEAQEELRTRLDETLEQLPGAEQKEIEAQRWEALEGRLTLLEQQPAAAPEEALTELRSSLESLREKVEEAPSAERLAALEERLEKVAETAGRAEPDEETIALRERLFELEEKVTGEQGAVSRLSALEEEIARAGEAEDPWTDRLDALQARLDDFESLTGRVTQLEADAVDGASPAGLMELTSRLRTLESEGAGLAEVRAQVEALRAELAARPENPPVADLRDELESLRAQAEREDAGPLRTRLADLEARLTDIESLSRIEGWGSRLDSVEEKLRGLDDVAELRRRLTVLEMSPQDTLAGPRPDDLAERVEALEARGLSVDSSPSSEERWSAALEALEARLGVVEQNGGAAAEVDDSRMEQLSQRLAELEARTGEAGDVVVDADLRARIESLAVQLDDLRDRADTQDSAPAGSDPRISEVIGRLNWLEQNSDASSTDLSPVLDRLAALESRPAVVAGGGSAEGAARITEILDRLERLENSGPGGDSAALHKESERWSQWARSTLEEIGELRRSVEDLQKQPAQGGGGLDAEAVEALGVTISTGLSKGEVRSLRQQMYFVYFAIGTLLALAVLFLFIYLTKG
ncbi:MAG: hypothetical protein GC160_19085 [Acidobacteria bacterium]|nr:hypothetical protein [Acidobacteriota bacterium]